MYPNRSKQQTWGTIFSGLAALALTGSAAAKIAHAPKMFDALIRAGIPQAAILPIALLELSCLALFLIPRTTVLGAFLLSGYFGGATLTHIIDGESIVPPLVIGLVIWAGAWLRVPELRSLLPVRKEEAVRTYGSAQPVPTRG
jgi:hypothetical protein